MIWQGSGWAKLSISETRYWAKSTVYPKACGKWCCVVNHPLPSISIQYSYKHLSLRRMSRFLHNNHNNVYIENKELNISYFSCPLLHRTAGDTERRYHLRYYKTGMCVHDTDNRWESYDSRNNFGIVDHKWWSDGPVNTLISPIHQKFRGYKIIWYQSKIIFQRLLCQERTTLRLCPRR